jgi:hypothetical protein
MAQGGQELIFVASCSLGFLAREVFRKQGLVPLALDLLALRNIEATSNKSIKLVAFKERSPTFQNPPELPIMPAETILHLKWCAGVEMRLVGSETPFEIVGIDPVGPAISFLLFQASPRKLKPRSIKPGASLGSIAHPNHDWSRIRDEPETFFTLL